MARKMKHGFATRKKSVEWPTYQTWRKIKQRCGNPNCHAYKYYGAKGIKVCERWESFENFFADMGIRPKGKTLDRIDGRKGYTPENCRWATSTEQRRNREDVIVLTYKGITLSLKEWALKLGINQSTLYYRVMRYGFSLERAFTDKKTA